MPHARYFSLVQRFLKAEISPETTLVGTTGARKTASTRLSCRQAPATSAWEKARGPLFRKLSLHLFRRLTDKIVQFINIYVHVRAGSCLDCRNGYEELRDKCGPESWTRQDSIRITDPLFWTVLA